MASPFGGPLMVATSVTNTTSSVANELSTSSTTSSLFNLSTNTVSNSSCAEAVSVSNKADSGKLSPRSVALDVTEEDEFDICIDEHEDYSEMDEEMNFLSPEDTAILLDYDDTLLASSWLAERRLGLHSSDDEVMEYSEELHNLAIRAATLLRKAMELGTVHLVTNAENGWIELTAKKFIPAIVEILPKVQIISARSTFQYENPTCPRTWKIHAFRHQLRLQFSDLPENQQSQRRINIISMGDSQHEREAVHVVAQEFANVICKSVKFVERPCIEMLLRQIDLVVSSFDYIASHAGNLDLILSQILFH